MVFAFRWAKLQIETVDNHGMTPDFVFTPLGMSGEADGCPSLPLRQREWSSTAPTLPYLYVHCFCILINVIRCDQDALMSSLSKIIPSPEPQEYAIVFSGVNSQDVSFLWNKFVVAITNPEELRARFSLRYRNTQTASTG